MLFNVKLIGMPHPLGLGSPHSGSLIAIGYSL